MWTRVYLFMVSVVSPALLNAIDCRVIRLFDYLQRILERYSTECNKTTCYESNIKMVY